MIKIVNSKNRLVSAVLVLVMMFTSLIGTTFAWFTDEVTSTGNTIQSGTLKIDLLHKSDDQWISLKENEDHKVFDYDKWEPGFTLVETLKVDNLGSLALKYRLSIEIAAGTARLGENGENLADVIDVWVYYGESTATDYSDITAADSTWVNKGTLSEVLANPKNFIGGQLTKDSEQTVTVALHMHELAGNEYQDLSVGEIYVNLIATQDSVEYDSFSPDYDENANYPVGEIYYTASAYVGDKIDADGKLTDDVAIGNPESGIYTVAPRGVKLADGVTTLVVTIDTMAESESNVSATHRSEVVRSFDVHVAGVADDNDVATVTYIESFLPAGLNSNNVMLYHVEDGVTNSMTIVSDPANHNEFSYDPLTGDAAVALAGYSEIVSYGDTDDGWDGESSDDSWYDASKSEYVLANAEQLVAFRNLVDSGVNFEGKTVKLDNDIYLNGHNFDPIGYGYDYDGFMTDGKTFNGTFDGNNKTIYGLYQNGWDANDCGNTYDYSMAGGGLFASVVDATIKNLTMSGANIVMECIDMGVLVGYAQGNCNFKNINIINCTIQNYNRYTGGVVGECSPRYDKNGTPLHSNHVFEDITVDSTTTVSSLWGSFDTSLGGILGGKWDKYGEMTQVTMTRCNVACQIDAFNDVTSAYQWYAYRRAGMLIGNSEQSADHKALANFLTCEDVNVIYGAWNNYSYCEFTNQSGSDDAAWQNNYPWVRVQAGLSCNAYSNPRYGHPIVDGEAITSDAHDHQTGNGCHVYLPFAQLYGGGQGVYGATEHPGVTEGVYTVTYMDGDKTLKVDIIGKDANDIIPEYTLWGVENYKVGGQSPIAWIDVNGNKITSIAADNKESYTVYAKWPGILTFSLVDDHDHILYSVEFTEGTDFVPNEEEINQVIADMQEKVDSSKKIIKVVLEQDIPGNLKDASENVVINVKYDIDGELLKPVKDEAGVVYAYQYVKNPTSSTFPGDDIVIPGYVGNIPILEVTLENNAFASDDAIASIKLPDNIQSIGSGALENGPQSNSGSNIAKGRSHITIYYAGTPEQWQEYMDYVYKNKDLYKEYNENTITIGAGEECLASSWDNGLEKGSRVFFLDENGKVRDDGYWELYYEQDGLSFIASSHKYTWVYHDHGYNENHNDNCSGHHNSVSTNYTDPNRGDSVYWKED